MTYRAFQPGDPVEWQDSAGRWHPGKIAAVRDGMVSTTYDADLDDGSTVADYSAGRFRKLNPAQPTSGNELMPLTASELQHLQDTCHHNYVVKICDERVFEECTRCRHARDAEI